MTSEDIMKIIAVARKAENVMFRLEDTLAFHGNYHGLPQEMRDVREELEDALKLVEKDIEP